MGSMVTLHSSPSAGSDSRIWMAHWSLLKLVERAVRARARFRLVSPAGRLAA
jgi:hypothetical protein